MTRENLTEKYAGIIWKILLGIILIFGFGMSWQANKSTMQILDNGRQQNANKIDDHEQRLRKLETMQVDIAYIRGQIEQLTKAKR